MIFAEINWLNISVDLLLVVFVIVCLLMALLILMQRPKQEGLGAAFGGGVTDQVFGARTTNVLQKGTVYLGSLFFLLSMTLAILIGKQNKQKSLLVDEKPGKSKVAVVEEPVDPEAEMKAQLEPMMQEIAAEAEAAGEQPAGETPSEDAPVEGAPTEEAPVEEAPVEEAPVEEAPVEEAPVEEAPDGNVSEEGDDADKTE